MRIKIILVLAIAIVVVAGQQARAQTPGLSGKWRGVIQTPDGNELQVAYTFKIDGDKLTGTAESPAGSVSIDDGKVNGDTFSFKVTVDGNDYPHTGKLHGDTCDVKIDFGGQMIDVSLKRDTGN